MLQSRPMSQLLNPPKSSMANASQRYPRPKHRQGAHHNSAEQTSRPALAAETPSLKVVNTTNEASLSARINFIQQEYVGSTLETTRMCGASSTAMFLFNPSWTQSTTVPKMEARRHGSGGQNGKESKTPNQSNLKIEDPKRRFKESQISQGKRIVSHPWFGHCIG